MPKAKVTKSNEYVPSSSATNRTPVKVNSAGTPIWYKTLMFGLLLLGLGWLIVYYLAGPELSFMVELGNWNYGIGFGLFTLGLLMTMGWR
ncbi:cell division protein CrgA [Corynebacterium pseudopelargi]|uniref:Cell division protein CrgA n=1 Tax=Corynebacterium pseudopelargi TaxID=2080757 RepID=A0A3G6IU78_9CORY|nr:cell division protein CrgA [Corynebacterium pseudopelargi]AZA08178.1 Cell division protein CrgA [Corynebacterium pseudopelargi]